MKEADAGESLRSDHVLRLIEPGSSSWTGRLPIQESQFRKLRFGRHRQQFIDKRYLAF